MSGACARQFCTAVAAARVDFDGEARVVWIDVLSDDRPAPAGCLCRRHADGLVAPRHWEVRDLRAAVAEAEPVLRPGTDLEREAEPLVVTGAPGAPAWSPHLFDQVDLGGMLDATSPLLSRAFRGVR